MTIPPPLHAWRAAAPAPDHGVRVDLGPTRSIVVAAAFDAADYGSTDNLLDATLRGYHAVAARRGTVQIAGRTASQAAFTSAGVPAVVIAQQTGPATERINLTLALTTDVAHERRDHVTLGKIARSFRWTPRS